jgi:hypothetical protein
MNKILTAFFSTLFLFSLGSSLFADTLALYGKKIAFYMDDRTGNFYLENPNPRSKSYKELLFKDDPPSSYLTVVLEGKPYKIIELKTVKPFAVADNIISGSFKLANQNIRVDFIMTNLKGNEYDSIICMLTYQNNEDPQTLVGARLLFDTMVGESQKKPSLFLSSTERIEYDRQINGNNIPEFILSGLYEMDNPDFGYGLFIYPSINELRPGSIIIGNWKRMDEKELAYSIDPLAKFRYNEFANPDAAVAVFYKDIYAKKAETISIGAVLSTTKLKSSLIRLSQAVTPQHTTLPQLPTVVTNYVVSNSVSPSNFVLSITSNTNREMNALSSQVDLLDRAAYLIDRLNSLLKNTNLQNLDNNDNSSLGRGLDNAVTRAPRDNPFDNDRNYTRVTDTNQGQRATATNASGTVVPVTPSLFVTNIIQTNIYYTNSTLSETEIQRLKEDRDRVQKQYEEKMQSLEVYYKELLKKQEDEFKATSSDYKQMLNEKEKIKNRNKKMERLNSTILSLDKKIDVIGALLELNLDFESMPPEKLEEARVLISELESKIR